MAPGGGLRLVGIQPQVVHLIGNRQPAPKAGGRQLPLQQLAMASGALVGEQQPRGRRGRGQGIGSEWIGGGGSVGIPLAQIEPQTAGGLQPLGGNRAAVTKNQKAIQVALGAQPLETEQGSQGLARSRAGVHQQVVAPRDRIEQPGAQQLDQAQLPLAGLNHPAAALAAGRGLAASKGLAANSRAGARAQRGAEIERWRRHRAIVRPVGGSFADPGRFHGPRAALRASSAPWARAAWRAADPKDWRWPHTDIWGQQGSAGRREPWGSAHNRRDLRQNLALFSA